MHAVFITFHSEAGWDDLREPFLEAAPAIRDVSELVSKTWVQDGATFGGFYLFTNGDAAQAYLDGELIAETKAMPIFSDFKVQQYTVIEEPSAITRGVPEHAVR